MIHCLALNQNQLTIVCGMKTGVIEVFDINLYLINSFDGHNKEVTAIDINDDVIVSGGRDRLVKTWSVKTKVNKQGKLRLIFDFTYKKKFRISGIKLFLFFSANVQ